MLKRISAFTHGLMIGVNMTLMSALGILYWVAAFRTSKTEETDK